MHSRIGRGQVARSTRPISEGCPPRLLPVPIPAPSSHFVPVTTHAGAIPAASRQHVASLSGGCLELWEDASDEALHTSCSGGWRSAETVGDSSGLFADLPGGGCFLFPFDSCAAPLATHASAVTTLGSTQERNQGALGSAFWH